MSNKNTKIKKASKEKKYDWMVYPDVYFATALSLCNMLPNGIHNEMVLGNHFFTDIGFRSWHADYFVIYPIIFNLKHGVELYLKALGNMDHCSYLYNHDLRSLFDFIIGNASNTNNQNILQKLKEETWLVIKKYYYGTYCPLVKNEGRPDKQNESERFPEVSNSYNLGDPYKWVTYGLISKTKEDIAFLEKKFAQAKRDIEKNAN